MPHAPVSDVAKNKGATAKVQCNELLVPACMTRESTAECLTFTPEFVKITHGSVHW